MKRTLLAIVLVTALNSVFPQPADLTQLPDLYNGIYDQYSYNYTNATMTARGNTGISHPDKIATALYNPAAYRSKDSHFAMEALSKFTSNEFNTRYYRNNYDQTPLDDRPHRTENTYLSPDPLSFVGIGLAPIYNNINIGLSYNLNRSIEYDSYWRTTHGNTGGVRDWHPRYKEHHYTLTANRPFGNLTIGANAIMLYQVFQGYRAEGIINKYDFSNISFTTRLGLLYDMQKHLGMQIGLTYTPKTQADMGKGEVDIKVINPTTISGGISTLLTMQLWKDVYLVKDLLVLFDVDYTRYSETADALKDTYTYKIGLEKRYRFVNLKAGYIIRPSAFDGLYLVKWFPNYEAQSTDNDLYEGNLPYLGNYKNTDMQIVTIGTDLQILKNTSLHLALLKDVSGNTGRFQINSGFTMNLAALRRIRN